MFKSKILSLYSFPFQKNHLKVSISSSCLFIEWEGCEWAVLWYPGEVCSQSQARTSCQGPMRGQHHGEGEELSWDAASVRGLGDDGGNHAKMWWDSNSVVADDRTILPSETEGALLPLAPNRIITHLDSLLNHVTNVPVWDLIISPHHADRLVATPWDWEVMPGLYKQI